MDNNAKELQIELSFFEKIEKTINKKESIILLILIFSIFVYIPNKILSYGWTPPDDVNRDVAFSTLDAKWSDILVIDEKFDIDHNAGWHQFLRFLYKNLNFSKEDLLYFAVVALFLLLNFCGIIISPSPICWCLALLMMLNFDKDINIRILLGRPFLISCAVTLIILRLWGVKYYKQKDFKLLENKYFKYFITILTFTLAVWTHGSWYLFLLIPFSFFLAGKTSDAIKLTICIILSTLIGAFLTGNFINFLYYHFVATFTIYSESTFNWLLVNENLTGCQSVLWTIIVTLIIYLCIYKNGFKLKELGDDPIFIMVLLCWMASIFVMRFWIDWGCMALLVWLTYRIGELIENTESLKNPRIRYPLCLLILVSLTIGFTNDSDGRFTKSLILFNQPIGFYNQETLEKLKGWEPGDGGIVFSNNMRAFTQHFYEYPNAKWKYILGFEAGIMKKEDKEVLRNIGYSKLDEAYTPWINKMTEKDRLILEKPLTVFPQLEWIRGSRRWWIGRLKKTNNKKISD